MSSKSSVGSGFWPPAYLVVYDTLPYDISLRCWPEVSLLLVFFIYSVSLKNYLDWDYEQDTDI